LLAALPHYLALNDRHNVDHFFRFSPKEDRANGIVSNKSILHAWHFLFPPHVARQTIKLSARAQ